MEREFPGCLVVRILGFHGCGLGSIPDWGTEISKAVWCGKKKKKKKTKNPKIKKIKRGGYMNIYN